MAEYTITELNRGELEHALKDDLAHMAKWAFDPDTDRWEGEYVRKARALREVLEQQGTEQRVRLLDYPLRDYKHMWNWIDMDTDADEAEYIAFKAD